VTRRQSTGATRREARCRKRLRVGRITKPKTRRATQGANADAASVYAKPEHQAQHGTGCRCRTRIGMSARTPDGRWARTPRARRTSHPMSTPTYQHRTSIRPIPVCGVAQASAGTRDARAARRAAMRDTLPPCGERARAHAPHPSPTVPTFSMYQLTDTRLYQNSDTKNGFSVQHEKFDA
jgi:hypothetical protein